jgi:cyanophycin synthetase
MISLAVRAVWHGPNPLTDAPVVVVARYADRADSDRLRAAIPVLQSWSERWYAPPEAAPSLDAFLADWALQALNFARGCLEARGTARATGSGDALIWLGFHDPDLGVAALRLAAQSLTMAAAAPAATAAWREQAAAALAGALERLWGQCRRRHPDYQAMIVMAAARQRDIPVAPAWGSDRFWRFGQGARSRVLFESSPCAEGGFGARIAASKSWSKSVLRALGVPTPPGELVTGEAELTAAAEQIGFPCAVKPIDRSGGKGVSAGVSTRAALQAAFALARAASAAPVLVEAHVPGEDHRLFVVEGRLVAAIRRVPPGVTGDGVATIAALVDRANAGRDAVGLWRSGFRRPIKLDAAATLHLAGLGLDPGSVLPSGLTIRVRSNANLSTGGTCVDVTAAVHPAVRALAESLAQTLTLPMLGVDYLTTDIAGAPHATGGQIIEINTMPGLDALIVAGWPIARAGDAALGDQPGRIPIDLLLVPDAALAPTIAAQDARSWPAECGWASADAARLGAARLTIPPAASGAAPGAGAWPWPGVATLLGHRTLARALIIAGHAQIRRHGLPVDMIRTATIHGALAAEWLAVVRRRSQQVHVVGEDQDPGAAPGGAREPAHADGLRT